MPTILRWRGHRFFFFSNEGFEPPHIHIESAGRWAKFWLEPVRLAASAGYSRTEIGRLKWIVDENQDFFQEKWDAFFRR